MSDTQRFKWTVPEIGANKNSWGEILNSLFDDIDNDVQRVTTISSTAPSSPNTGDLWVDTSSGTILKIWDGSGWETISSGSGGATELAELSDVGSSTATAGNILSADGSDFDSKTPDNAGLVDKSNAQTVNGVKTFGSFPVTPSSAPTTDYQVANKKYVDDNGGGPTLYTGQDSSMGENDTLIISHDSETGLTRSYDFYREVAGIDTDWSTLDFDLADEDNYSQGNYQQTAVKFQVDTADVTGHFEDSGSNPVTVGTGNTCPRIQVGCRFKLSGDATIYEIDEVTGDGEADNEIGFIKQDGTAATKATGTYDVEWVRGTEFDGSVKLNQVGSGASDTFTHVLGSDDAGAENYTFRMIIPAAQISTSGSRIRVTITGHSSSTSEIDNVSIVERSGSSADGTTTPTELLFGGGGHGCTITAGNTAVSDWLTYSLDETKDYLISVDVAVSNGNRREDLSTGYGRYFKASDNSYNAQNMPAGYTDQSGFAYTSYVSKIEVEDIAYAINQIYVTCTNDSNQANSTDWEDINSITITETLNGENIYYSASFDDRTTWGIFDDTVGDVGWRPIARNNAGTWQYNSNTTAGANDVTWANSTIDSQGGALSQAMGVTANQMTRTEAEAITDAQWNNQDGAMVGWSTSVNTVDFGAGLISTSASATPELSQITVNYLAPTYWEPIVVGDDWDVQCFSTKTKLIKLGTGTDNVKGSVRIYS